VRDLAAALRGLTVRGRSFLAAGGACRYRLACTRRIDPPRVTAGESARVRVRLDNLSRLRTAVMLVEDTVPDSLGVHARFVLDRVEPGGTRVVSYPLAMPRRGRYPLGPMSIRITDPFGFCELSRGFRSRDELVVAPAIETLPAARLDRFAAASSQRRPALHGDDETMTRPYQSGDDLRRVHWRTTARVGDLMVRLEDAPRLGGATILLDDHLGSWGPYSADPDSPFEWAVSAAGSIAAHLARAGQSVRLVTHQGLVAAGTAANVSPVLDELATIQQTAGSDPRAAYTAMTRGDTGMLVLVLGQTSTEVARRLASARTRHAPGVALLVDLARWGALPGTDTGVAACERVFAGAGWRALVTGRGSLLAEEWPRLMARSPLNTRMGSGSRRFGAAAAAATAGADPGETP
jgi:uncharacterized protein (DUF58 family)